MNRSARDASPDEGRLTLRGTNRWAGVAMALFFLALTVAVGRRDPGVFGVAGVSVVIAWRSLMTGVVVSPSSLLHVGWFRRERFELQEIVDVVTHDGLQYSAPRLQLQSGRSVTLKGLSSGHARARDQTDLIREQVERGHRDGNAVVDDRG